MAKKKIEDLNPHYQTVLDCLRYALMCLDKEDTGHARHAIRDALYRLGFREDDLQRETRIVQLSHILL
jgi:hypothetical protein